MSEEIDDEVFARTANLMGAVALDQIEAAREFQQSSIAGGATISLAEALEKQGSIPAVLRSNIEKRILAQRRGGIKQLGSFKILKKLGEGGMGAVFLAEDTVIGRKVALKVLPKKHASDQSFLSRFRREARSTAQLNHPNIVAAYNTGEEQGLHYYVMEFCDGEPLDALLKRERQLSWDQAVGIVTQIARGLQHAHGHDVIHRDIKPANIFIAKEGVAKILDLGLSKNIGDTEQSYNTQSGTALGTPHYISPEQARGDKIVDGRTDLYSLGATLYHLVTGQTPFQGSTAALIMMKHLTAQLPNPQDFNENIPDGVCDVIRKMMAKEPSDRYANCESLLDDLELIGQGKAPEGANLDPGKSSVEVRKKLLAPRRTTGATKVRGPVRVARSNAEVPVKKAGNPALLKVGIAAGAVVLALLGFFAFGRTKAPSTKSAPADSANTQPAAQLESPKPPQPAAVPAVIEEKRSASSAPAVAALATPAPAVANEVIDLLKLVDVKRDRVTGDWSVTPGGLQSTQFGNKRGDWAFMEFPYLPPAQYDFEIEFTITKGDGGDVFQFIAVPGHWFLWRMLPPANFGTQLDGLRYDDPKRNKEAIGWQYRLAEGHRYRSLVEVRMNFVRALIDGKEVAHFTGDLKRLTEDFLKLRDKQYPGVGGIGNNVLFHKATLRLVASGKTSSIAATNPASEPWQNMLNSPTKLSLYAGATLANGTLTFPAHSAGQNWAGATLVNMPADGALRIIATFNPDNPGPQLRARGSPNGRYNLEVEDATHVTLTRVANGVFKPIQSFTVSPALEASHDYVLELRTVGSTLTVKLNGATLGTLQDETYPTGGFEVTQFKSKPPTVKTVEFLPLQ